MRTFASVSRSKTSSTFPRVCGSIWDESTISRIRFQLPWLKALSRSVLCAPPEPVRSVGKKCSYIHSQARLPL